MHKTTNNNTLLTDGSCRVGRRWLRGRVGCGRPLEAVPRQQHVPDEGLYGSLADQANEEELFYHRRGNSSQGGEAEKQLAEPCRLVGILTTTILLQRALGLLLELLYHRRGCQADGVWRTEENINYILSFRKS